MKQYEMRLRLDDGSISIVTLDAADIDKECADWGLDVHSILFERSIPLGQLTAWRTLVDGRVTRVG